METFSPEFSAYWLTEREQVGEYGRRECGSSQPLSPQQQVALEELVERVNAARSVV